MVLELGMLQIKGSSFTPITLDLDSVPPNSQLLLNLGISTTSDGYMCILERLKYVESQDIRRTIYMKPIRILSLTLELLGEIDNYLSFSF